MWVLRIIRSLWQQTVNIAEIGESEKCGYKGNIFVQSIYRLTNEMFGPRMTRLQLYNYGEAQRELWVDPVYLYK